MTESCNEQCEDEFTQCVADRSPTGEKSYQSFSRCFNSFRPDSCVPGCAATLNMLQLSQKPFVTALVKGNFGAPVHGGWGDWGEYNTCDKDCGGGTRVRSRSCDNPLPANGGYVCEGPTQETQNCNTQT